MQNNNRWHLLNGPMKNGCLLVWYRPPDAITLKKYIYILLLFDDFNSMLLSSLGTIGVIFVNKIW